MMKLPFFSRDYNNNGLLSSKLYSEQTFYKAFEKDLKNCRHEAIIESPFISSRRVEALLPILRKAVKCGVRVVINTRDPYEHDPPFDAFAVDAIADLHSIGVEVIYIGKHHRKLAIFDRHTLWEGSLNILSQNDSCEVMRRIESTQLASEMMRFLDLDRYV